MKIIEHRLHSDSGDPLPFVKSPRAGGQLAPRYIVLHFTVGQSAKAAVAWLSKKSPGPSAHVVIGRDGSVIQLVPFDRIAFHAGPSKWEGIVGLDPYSIGIELDNAGPMRKQGGEWVSTFKKTYKSDQVVEAVHKNGGRYRGWHKFTDEQIEALTQVCRALAGEYPIEHILGHDDISPGRKWDPGPAFPMEVVRWAVLGGKSVPSDTPV